ncbi:hypothetical protein E3Q06_03998 [Wallemia mellicola]|uniref:Nucleolar 27S pre-rRNA processing Urb2/Npa2 C-terminal domain-containing protein n=1 Tax=Wallemia mellicola TaxID=1708541 RepID=A0AB74K8R4_9BASI|nr:hypothetical protein E3Q21_04000 [Wallemia mellicola]TIB83864.1 hypothetical protein E3Q20_03953 [Wallemia mellicola]TIC38230.1 hypothetical protein E3Q07_04010 [Wallemia mellicola]TIC45291.1 hypothetical protein E3Q06_03998 [Wallemia mellicola]TIC50758.1 hypothetical protein E3Q04_04001 [Wallemia mellicola]
MNANIVRIIKKSALLQFIDVVYKEKTEDLLEDVRVVLDLTIGHYNRDSVLDSYSIFLSNLSYEPIDNIYVKFIRSNKFNKKVLSNFLLNNLQHVIHNYAFASHLVNQTDTVKALIDKPYVDDFLIYYLTNNYNKELLEHFIRNTQNDALLSRLLELGQSKSTALNEELLQYLIDMSINGQSTKILKALWQIEPDHMFKYLDKSTHMGLGDVDLLKTVINVYSDVRALPSLTESLVDAIASTKMSLDVDLCHVVVHAYQHYVTSDQVESLVKSFSDTLTEEYTQEKPTKKRKSETKVDVQKDSSKFTSIALLAELFFMALPKLLTTVTSTDGERIRERLQKLSDDISPNFNLDGKELHAVRLSRCLSVNQLSALPPFGDKLAQALNQSFEANESKLAAEYTQLGLFNMSRSQVDDEAAKKFLNAAIPIAMKSSHTSDAVLVSLSRYLYVIEHYARDAQLDSYLDIICLSGESNNTKDLVSSKTLASALFWELGRFRTRLLERLEKTLKSDNHEESSKALTLLLRFPRGSYISKFLRNLAIDTAMKLEGSGTVALLTLRKVLLSLLAENTTASSKTEEFAIHLATSESWDTFQGAEKKELDSVTMQLLNVLTRRPIIKSDPAHLFKKLSKKQEKGTLKMMPASCILDVYISNHKKNTEENTESDSEKYVDRLSQAILSMLTTKLAKPRKITVANLRALVACIRITNSATSIDVAKTVTLTRVHSKQDDAELDAVATVLHFFTAALSKKSSQLDVALAAWCIYHERASAQDKQTIEKSLADAMNVVPCVEEVAEVVWPSLHAHIREPSAPLSAVFAGLRIIIRTSKDGRYIRKRLSGLLIDVSNAAAAFKHLPPTIGSIVGILEAVVLERAILLQSTDVGSILMALTNVVSPADTSTDTTTQEDSQWIYERICSTLLHLIRLRRDICTGHAPSLALLMSTLMRLLLQLRPSLGMGAWRSHNSIMPSWINAEIPPDSLSRLLEALLAKTIPITSHEKTQVGVASSMKEAFARHAYIILHTYAQGNTSSASFYPANVRVGLQPGLFALCECVDTHREREFMLSGLTDEGARSVIKTLWKEYDSQKYVGMS